MHKVQRRLSCHLPIEPYACVPTSLHRLDIRSTAAGPAAASDATCRAYFNAQPNVFRRCREQREFVLVLTNYGYARGCI